jgi:predicted nucleic acid-binding protein
LRVLFDTNVVLDLLLDREPHSTHAAELFSRVECGEITGFVCATTITTIHYLASKANGIHSAKKGVQNLLTLFDIAPVNRSVLEGALVGKFHDYEDAVVHEAARQIDAKAIVTRNARDFKFSTIPVYSPDEMVKMLHSEK